MPLLSIDLLVAFQNNFLPTRLMACGVKLIRHLFEPATGQWSTSQELQRNFRGLRPPSLRLIEHELRLLHSALRETWPLLFRERGCRLPTCDNVDLRTVPLTPDSPTDFILPSSEHGLIASSKVMYRTFNKELNHTHHTSTSHWHDIGYIDSSTKLNWTLIYKLPISKIEGDVQFRLNHNFLPSLEVLHHFNRDISPLCGWCGEKGSIQHLFIRCPAIQPALDLLHNLLKNLLPGVILTFDSYWALIPQARGRSREAVRLANFLIVSFKNVIYYLYRSSIFSDPLIVFVHRVKNRILYEFYYYKSCHNTDAFKRKWSICGTLFHFSEKEEIVWLI